MRQKTSSRINHNRICTHVRDTVSAIVIKVDGQLVGY
jgi:hypothetical protein